MKLQLKNIPDTSYEKYISGWESLNIPDKNGDVADWHQTQYFHTCKNKEIKLFKYNEILKNDGVEKRIISIPYTKKVYIATHARAIIDLLLQSKQGYEFNQMYGMTENISKSQKEKLKEYLLKFKHLDKIKDYLKYEYGE